ncbi:bcl-2 1 isoform X1 [Brachionus plicatilis]|uniref:Bcl-2 1 isoform X1 n=1 Tax=Brachionus plicatilis TaxID=10195 RepID=A0A3M7QMK0_BRAPC|nr:bcl-2 1 isoform X1 [Brachionus plicatilis]
MNTFENQTQSLLSDYLCWRLIKSGHSNLSIVNKENLEKNSKLDLCLIIRQLGYQFEIKYNSQYLALATRLEINAFNYKQVLGIIFNELFELEYENGKNFNWGRIIGLFSLAGCLVMRLYEDKVQNLIPNVLECINFFLTKNSRIRLWFHENNYWDGLIEKFNNCECILSKEDVFYKNNTESAANNFFNVNKLIVLGIGALTMFTFGFIYFKRSK